MEKQKRLLVLYDVSALDDEEIARLELEAIVQAEASDGHPDVPVVSAVYERPAMSEIPISDEADAVAEVMGGDPPDLNAGWRGALPPFWFWFGAGAGMLSVGTSFTDTLYNTGLAALVYVAAMWAITSLARYVGELVAS